MKLPPILTLSLAATATWLTLAFAQETPRAALGEPAPDFSLLAVDGSRHELSRLRGRVVVLEWFNPDCPYSAKYHRSGLLRALNEELQPRGVTWLAIASGTAAASADRLGAVASEWKIAYPILRDPDCSVARVFGASRTPHLFVIDREGVIRYQGAVDDASGDLERLGKEDHLLDAVAAVLAGRKVERPSTTPFGTGVSPALVVEDGDSMR